MNTQPADKKTIGADIKASVIREISTLIEHAKETHPHFESIRGQNDIANAEWAVLMIEKYLPQI